MKIVTRHYKKARLYVWKYNCVKFGVPMYNSLREKWRTNLPVKKEGKKKERKKETRKEDLLHSKSDCVPTNANCSKVCNIFQDSTGAVYKGNG